jgi:hypothetical protein
MNKVEIIARRIFGWKLNNWDKWYDVETNEFIYVQDFQPEDNLDHAMRIVKRLEKFGFKYSATNKNEVCFNEVCATGDHLAQAITNAAYCLADNRSIDDEWF